MRFIGTTCSMNDPSHVTRESKSGNLPQVLRNSNVKFWQILLQKSENVG
jgi:hypothetical protein